MRHLIKIFQLIVFINHRYLYILLKREEIFLYSYIFDESYNEKNSKNGLIRNLLEEKIKV